MHYPVSGKEAPVKRYTQIERATLWLLRDGCCTIGGDFADATPRFEADIAPLYISRTLITNRQYEEYDPTHQRSATSPNDKDAVVDVSYADAQGYCRWYAELANKAFRLATEVEWEYACRGGSPDLYPFGASSERADEFLWDCQNCNGRMPPLETKQANGHGLHDMLGTAWEWTGTLYKSYPVAAGDGRDDPTSAGARVIRGGSFRLHRDEMGCALRRSVEPSYKADDLGFRIVRSL
jgi:formylglycine-generating enzyme required for sulfatase activity